MLGEGGTPLSKLLAAIREYQAREIDPRDDDLKRLRDRIDALKAELAIYSTRDTPEPQSGGGNI
jgi:hypothetical protein